MRCVRTTSPHPACPLPSSAGGLRAPLGERASRLSDTEAGQRGSLPPTAHHPPPCESPVCLEEFSAASREPRDGAYPCLTEVLQDKSARCIGAPGGGREPCTQKISKDPISNRFELNRGADIYLFNRRVGFLGRLPCM